MSRSLLQYILKMAVLLAAAVLLSCSLFAQGTPPGDSVGVAFTTMRYIYENQYVGVGLDYTHLHHRWIGARVDADLYPERQLTLSDIGGLPIIQLTGAALIGHAWGRFGLHGEAGVGGMFPQVFTGNSGGHSVYAWRALPSFVSGGIFRVAVSKRWSIDYEVRDSLTFVGPYNETYLPPSTSVRHLNSPQARVSLQYNFR